MKKIIVLMLALVLAVSMVACGDDAPATNPAAVITKATTPVENPTEPAATQPSTSVGGFVFAAEGENLVMGQMFDGSLLSEPKSMVELPSCAIDGVDYIYTYEGFELTASDEGDGAYITAILILEDGATTEGVKIGDEESKITATYGDDCENDGVQYTYEIGGTQLIFLVQDGIISSIEYRMVM